MTAPFHPFNPSGNIHGRGVLAVGPSDSPLPDNWEWVQLTKIARLESGHTPSRRHPEFWDGGIPWLSIPDARKHHSGTVQHTAQTISSVGLANSSARLLPEGTVCLSRTASIGYVVVLGTEMATSQDFVNWVCSQALDPRYLMYILLCEGRDGLAKLGKGTVHTTIYFPTVRALHIALPPLQEQRRIISVIDEAIGYSRQARDLLSGIPYLLQNLRRSTLVAAMRGVFTSVRGRPKKLAHQVALDRPSHWQRVRLADVISGFQAGRSPRSKGRPIQNGEYGVLKVSAISSGHFRPSENKALLPGDCPDKESTVCAGDVLISRANTPELVGTAVYVESNHPDLMLSDKTLRIRYLPTISGRFLVAALRTPSVRRYFTDNATGTSASMRNLSQKKLADTTILLPPMHEQDAIAETLRISDRQIAALENAATLLLQDIDSFQKSVLAKAFCGELTDPEEQDESVVHTLARVAGMTDQKKKGKRNGSATRRTTKRGQRVRNSGDLRRAIQAWPHNTFSSEEIRAQAPSGYEEFRNALFRELTSDTPSIQQLFDPISGRVMLRKDFDQQ